MSQNKLTLPKLGLGTWKAKPNEVNRAVREAIVAGYRHFDCSPIYENEAEVGQALKEAIRAGDVRREELWITSKLWNNKHEASKVQAAFYQSLDDLQLYYLDLYLIHWPVAFRQVQFPKNYTRDEFYSLEELPLTKTWEAMLDLKEQGIVKHTGVSNFSVSKIKDLMAHFEGPEFNQVELHPYLTQKDLVQFCKNNGIKLIAFKPLGSGMRTTEEMEEAHKPALLQHPTVQLIAEDNGMTPAQVLLAWSIQNGIHVIPKSANKEHIQENANALKFQLTPAQMVELTILNWDFRFVDGQVFCEGQSPYTVEQIWR